MEILDQSDTKRLQVVHTTFKALAGQERREFVEKKLSFAVRDEKIQTENDRNPNKGRSVSPCVVKDKGKNTSNVAYYTYFSSCSNAPENLQINKRGFHVT